MEPCSSDKGRESTMDCSMLLELDENDTLFIIKQKLLQMKGLKSKECIYLNHSFGPDDISTTLKLLLRIARIKHLDEGEIYFDDDDVSSPVEFYSPRNEIGALNSVISLVDASLSSSVPHQMDVLQKLREAAVEMICDFGDKNGTVTTIVGDYSCDEENCLLEWGESNGVRTSLHIAYVEGAGRGTIAKEDLNVGDVALEIPSSLIISEELVQNSNMYPVLEKIDGMSSETMLLLWSMNEKHNSNSKFKLYFNTLPEDFSTGLSFGVGALLVLDQTLLMEEILQAKQHLRSQYDQLFPALCNDHPEVFLAELYTWEQFLWACELWYSNSMKIMFPDGCIRTCLIPIAGFINHSLCPHILYYGKIDATTNTLKFPLSRPCRAGDQCFLSYGNLSSSHLLTFYGFLPQGDNIYDIIPLDIDASDEDCTDGTHLNKTTHMVRGTWFSKNKDLFHYGLPSPLLDALRNAYGPGSQTKTKENLETEMRILEDLRLIFDDMMGNFEEQEVREDSRWDIKLAVGYQDIEREIVSSVLTSCQSGKSEVESALLECMYEDVRG